MLEDMFANRMFMDRGFKKLTKMTSQSEDKAQKKERLLKRAQPTTEGHVWTFRQDQMVGNIQLREDRD